MRALTSVLLVVTLLGVTNCDNVDLFAGKEILKPDPCDVAIAMNLKYLKLDIVGQQLQNDAGHYFISIDFNFSFEQPSTLNRSCFNSGVKSLSYVDASEKVHKFKESYVEFTQLGLQLNLPLNEVQNVAFLTTKIVESDKNGFSNDLKLVLDIGNTRVNVREYQIHFVIQELMDNSISFNVTNVQFQNARAGVKLG